MFLHNISFMVPVKEESIGVMSKAYLLCMASQGELRGFPVTMVHHMLVSKAGYT